MYGSHVYLEQFLMTLKPLNELYIRGEIRKGY
jgi:hypothetical protein